MNQSVSWAEHRQKAEEHHRSMMRHILILGSVLYTLLSFGVAFWAFVATWEWAGPSVFLLVLLLAGILAYAGYIGWHALKLHGEKQLLANTVKDDYEQRWAPVALPAAPSVPVRMYHGTCRPMTNQQALSNQQAFDDEMQDNEDARAFHDETHVGPDYA